jgi:Uma2 family endonuclease
MTAEAATSHLVSVEDYLEGELTAAEKHEYLGGMVYAMAGATNAHNRIATNALGILHAQLRGKKCQPFNSDTKVRVLLPTHTRFYYPDAMVVCRQNPADEHFQDEPAVIIEVISESTRRTDGQEKREAYLAIPSLRAYLLIESNAPEVVVWRRASQGFAREVHAGREAVIELPEIEARLPLGEVYEGI